MSEKPAAGHTGNSFSQEKQGNIRVHFRDSLPTIVHLAIAVEIDPLSFKCGVFSYPNQRVRSPKRPIFIASTPTRPPAHIRPAYQRRIVAVRHRNSGLGLLIF